MHEAAYASCFLAHALKSRWVFSVYSRFFFMFSRSCIQLSMRSFAYAWFYCMFPRSCVQLFSVFSGYGRFCFMFFRTCVQLPWVSFACAMFFCMFPRSCIQLSFFFHPIWGFFPWVSLIWGLGMLANNGCCSLLNFYWRVTNGDKDTVPAGNVYR